MLLAWSSSLGKSGNQRPIKKGDVARTRTRTRTGKAPSSLLLPYHFSSLDWPSLTRTHAHGGLLSLCALCLSSSLSLARSRGERKREASEVGDQEAFVWLRDHKLHHGPITEPLLSFKRAPLPSHGGVRIVSSLPQPTLAWHLPEPIPPPPHKYRLPCHCHSPSLLSSAPRLLPRLPRERCVESWSAERERERERDDEGVVDGGAAGAAGALLRRPGRRLVLAGSAGQRRRRQRVVAGGEQALRGGARAGRRGRAGPVGAGGVAAARQDGGRRHDALRRPRERRLLHRGRPRPLPPLQHRRLPGLRVHPRLGRRRRPGLQALLLHGGRQRQARARLGAGAQERGAMDRGRAQAVLDGPEEVRARGLAEHLAQLRDEPHANAGGQPRAEVLHPAQLRRQGQAPLQHPRHHHRQHSRRRPRRQQQQPLAVAALRAHGQLLRPGHLGAVGRARGQQAAPAPAPSSRRAPPLHAGPSLRQRETRGQQ